MTGPGIAFGAGLAEASQTLSSIPSLLPPGCPLLLSAKWQLHCLKQLPARGWDMVLVYMIWSFLFLNRNSRPREGVKADRLFPGWGELVQDHLGPCSAWWNWNTGPPCVPPSHLWTPDCLCHTHSVHLQKPSWSASHLHVARLNSHW